MISDRILCHLANQCFITVFHRFSLPILKKINPHIPTICSQRRSSGKDNSATPQGIIYYSKEHPNLFHLKRSSMCSRRNRVVTIRAFQHAVVCVATESWATFQLPNCTSPCKTTPHKWMYDHKISCSLKQHKLSNRVVSVSFGLEHITTAK